MSIEPKKHLQESFSLEMISCYCQYELKAQINMLQINFCTQNEVLEQLQ